MSKLTKAWVVVRSAVPDFRDMHIYGGLGLFAVAGFFAYGWVGPMVVGAVLFYLGVWRLG